MDSKQITSALQDIFDREKHRIVFWYDGEQEFVETVAELMLDGVQMLRIDQLSPLEVKLRLEMEDREGRYLLYAPFHEPEPEQDWLLDIRLYSRTFHADKASIILSEMGLKHQARRAFIKDHLSFFQSLDRFERLKKWITPNDGDTDIAIKMLAVLARAEQPDLFAVLIKLYDAFCPDGHFDPEQTPKAWADIQKMGLEALFWQLVARTFGYDRKDGRNLSDLITRIMVTDLAESIKGETPTAVAHFVLPDHTGAVNTAVFLSQWRSHIRHHQHYRKIAGAIGQKINDDSLVAGYEPESLMEVMTFEAVEKRIIRALRDDVIENAGHRFQKVRDMISRRLDGYWATAAYSDTGEVNFYKTVYQALDIATHLFAFRRQFDAGLSYPDPAAMYRAYTDELFAFDQFYRMFNEYADTVEKAGWDVLKSLRESVESCYTGWFLENISLAWGDFLESKEAGLLNHWQIPGIINQHRFFTSHVAPVLEANPKTRVFVIISDALRYEAAAEFCGQVNSRYRFRAELSSMLGVLPGYTALGMAALLPHDSLSFKDNGDVLANGKPTASMSQRDKILSEYAGTAIRADDLMTMSKDRGREFVKPYRVIYIFHDRIDAIGDKAATEGETFHAVRKAIDDLQALVSFIINNLGSRVIVTADHGFIYHERPAEPIDRSSVAPSGTDIVKTHKRFILGKDLEPSGHAFYGNTAITAGTQSSLSFAIPKGNKRFHFAGGARFFHGGAMPAEIIVPVVTVSEARGSKLAATEVRRVGVALLGTPKKIVSNIPRFKFIQTAPVSERVHPRILKISLRDGNELISNEETVTFDSRTAVVEERTRTVKLNLKSGPFDRHRQYDLVLRHADDDTEYERLPLVIDLAFARDF